MLIKLLENNSLFKRITKSNIGLRMFNGIFWTFTGTSFAKFIVLIAGIMCARILGKSQYGEFGIIRSTIGMFVTFGSVGLGLTATKYISEFKEICKEKVSSVYYLTNLTSVVTGATISFLILILAPFIAEKSLNAPNLVNDLRLGSLLLFITTINTAQNGTLAGFEDFKSISINTLIASICESIFMIFGAYYFGVTGAILGFGLGYFVFIVKNFFSIKNNFTKYNIVKCKNSINFKDLSILYKFSLPATLSSLLVAPVFWIIRSMLVRNSGFAEAGIFEIADQWKLMILFIPSAISQIILPMLSNIASSNGKTYWKILRINAYINGGVSLLLAVIVTLCSGFIIKFYGTDYNNVFPLVILAFSTIFSSLSNVAGISIASRSKMWIGFGFNLFWAIFLISLTYIFLNQNMGSVGLALAVFYSYLVLAFFQFIYLFWLQKKSNGGN